MNRFFAPDADFSSGRVRLLGDEAHHCSRVFRHEAGDEVEVFDGAGNSAAGRISAVSKNAVEVETGEPAFTEPLPVEITLIQAMPKAKIMDLIVQKAAEIGAASIVPVETARTVVKLADEAKKQAKWQRIALESCKQCGLNWLPKVESPAPLTQALERCAASLKLVAALSEKSRKLREIAAESPIAPIAPTSVAIAIGPEGDFSPAELEILDRAEFRRLSLGPTVLRSETAAIYALSIVSHEFLAGTASFG